MKPRSTTNPPRIAIAGGGPGALTVGLLLHQRQIPFTIYEMRSRPTQAQLDEPSGSLDLHDGTGLAAIRACGLFNEFIKYTSDCEESMIIADETGAVLHSDSGNEANRPEIARNNITRLFLAELPEACLRWDRKILRASSDGAKGEVSLEILNMATGEQTIETHDLVVGADGAWSKIRPLLSPASVTPTPISWLQLVIPSVPERYPELDEYLGRGMFVCLGNRHMISSMRGVRGCEIVVVQINDARAGDGAGPALGEMTVLEARDRLLSEGTLFGGFADKIRDLLRVALDGHVKTNGEGARLEVKRLAVLPRDHTWAPRANATIIGDAAHVMLPSGEGVNLAMRDALDVAGVIAAAWEQCGDGGGQTGEVFQEVVGPLLAEAEGVMQERARKEAEDSVSMNATMFGEDGARALARFMEDTVRQVNEMAASKEQEL